MEIFWIQRLAKFSKSSKYEHEDLPISISYLGWPASQAGALAVRKLRYLLEDAGVSNIRFPNLQKSTELIFWITSALAESRCIVGLSE
jgi:hypothetical protein